MVQHPQGLLRQQASYGIWTLSPPLLSRQRGNINHGLPNPSNLERVLGAPLPFCIILGLVLLFSSCPFKLWLFCMCVPQGRQICSQSLSTIPLHCSLQHWGINVPLLTKCLCLSCSSLCDLSFVCLLLFRSYLVSPQFFGRNHSINRYRFSVFMKVSS